MIIGMVAISLIYAVQSYVTFQVNAETPLQNNQFKSTYKEYSTKVTYHGTKEYSWRDIQGLSWIFDKEEYE